MGKRRATTAKKPASKRAKVESSREDAPPDVPESLEEYVGTFHDIDYTRARRWCTQLGRKGRGGSLEVLREWLKDNYDRESRTGVDQPNGLPRDLTSPRKTSSESRAKSSGAKSPGSNRGSPKEKTPGSKRGSPSVKSPASSRADSGRGETPKLPPTATLERLLGEEPSEDAGAVGRIQDAWHLLRTATNFLERDRKQPGVEEALRQLNDVLFQTLAEYETGIVSGSPGHNAIRAEERRLEIDEARHVEERTARWRENYGRQPRADPREVLEDEDEGEDEVESSIRDAILDRARSDDDVDAVLNKVYEIAARGHEDANRTYNQLIDLAFDEVDQETLMDGGDIFTGNDSDSDIVHPSGAETLDALDDERDLDELNPAVMETRQEDWDRRLSRHQSGSDIRSTSRSTPPRSSRRTSYRPARVEEVEDEEFQNEDQNSE